MDEIVEKTINSVNSGVVSFCRFITANDTGRTGSHQSGYYIPRSAYSLFFDKPGEKGTIEDKIIKIKWQDDFETENRAIYYGQKTRNEYRLTRFGREFPFLKDSYTGSLLVITKFDRNYYEAFVLEKERDIDYFLDSFGMSPVDTNSIIEKRKTEFETGFEFLSEKFLTTLTKKFPSTLTIAEEARNICSKEGKITNQMIQNNPDSTIMDWLKTEYELFKKIESYYYQPYLAKSTQNLEDTINLAKTIMNRRASRAGLSLEHHLDTVFTINRLRFSHPGKTEGKKKPDFIFPGNTQYHNQEYDSNKLVFLGAKTTCKDRWRQILNEANRIQIKHLFTLQQGISLNQLGEMYSSGVILVVPRPYITTYPREFRDRILDLESFIVFTKQKQEN